MSEGEIKIEQELNRIINDIAVGIGDRNYQSYDNLTKTAHYIEKQFQNLGYEVKDQVYEINGQTFRNVIAEIPNNSEEIMIVGAHYDSCFNPGADDNASGIAGLIEIARLLKNQTLKTKVQFVAFVNEEPPFFQTEDMGSTVYVKDLKDKSVKVKGAIILEMIGYYSDKRNSQKYPLLLSLFYPNKANFIAFVGNYPSKKFYNELKSNFKKNSDFPISGILAPGFIPSLSFSDHWSFWEEGFPAVMITDTSFYRNKHYHLESDLPATLDYKRMALVVHGLASAIIEIAEK